MIWPAIMTIVILLVIIALLCLKIYMLKRSAREIDEGFEERLDKETNSLIAISGRDGDMLALCRDINDELRKLRQTQLKYEQGDKELKTAITNISHDIRTPLTAIFGYLNMLDEMPLDEKQRRCCDIIRERCEALRRLSEELFEYSVIMTKETESSSEEVYINKLLEESIMTYYAALTERGIEPEISITPEKVTRNTDKAALSRVISNLISNALKYSDGDLEIKLNNKGVMSFANTAKALTSVEVERLFDRFYTVNDSRISTGLGLSIAKTLTKKMNAEISAEYKEGRLIITLRL